MVAAKARPQHPDGLVHQQPDVRPAIRLPGLPGPLQPAFALVELTRPDQRGGHRDERGRDHPFVGQAVPLGQLDRLAAAPLGDGERVDPRREAQLRQAPDLEVGPADLPGQRGALPQVAFGVGQTGRRPRLGRPQVQQRQRPQVAAQRDVLVGLPAERRGQEGDLLKDAAQVTAAPGQRHPHGRDRQLQATPAIRRRRLGVRLRHRQVGGRVVEPPEDMVAHGAHQGQLGVILPGRERPHQGSDGLGAPVEHQAEGLVGEQPSRFRPVAGRLGMPDGIGRLAVRGEPPRRPAGAGPGPPLAASGGLPAAGSPPAGGGSGTRSARGRATPRTRSRPPGRAGSAPSRGGRSAGPPARR